MICSDDSQICVVVFQVGVFVWRIFNQGHQRGLDTLEYSFRDCKFYHAPLSFSRIQCGGLPSQLSKIYHRGGPRWHFVSGPRISSDAPVQTFKRRAEDSRNVCTVCHF